MRVRHFVKKALTTPPNQIASVLYKASRRYLKEKQLRQAAFRQRNGLSDAEFRRELELTSDKEPLRLNPVFFLGDTARKFVAEAFSRHFPEAHPQILSGAEEVLLHRFDLLGSGKRSLGDKIDWHRDFKSGYRWEPGTYFADYERVRLEDRSDIKVTRELSRFQHLTLLGKAYWLTEDEQYPKEFVHQIQDWIVENPPLFSINWDCAMDVAIRAVNWVWAARFFGDSPLLTAEFRREFFKSLLSHGRYVFHTLEYYEAPVEGKVQRLNSNHYLSNLAGLLFIALSCPQFKESARWLEYAQAELFREIEEQVHPSGVDYEHSVSYHRLVLELFLYPALLLRMNGHRIPDVVWQRLEKMFEYVLYYTKPDGTHPLVGDADDGRLVILNSASIDSHRYLLSLGAILFNRGDMKAAAGNCDETCLWTLGPSSLAQFSNIPASAAPLGSKGFQDAGFFVLRSKTAYLFVDAADTGIRGRGSHDHNDRLSFELCFKSATFFSDSGAYVYSADPPARNRFRSTRAHSTVLVDSCEQNTLGEGLKLFWIGNEAAPRVELWESTAQADRLRVSHIGYHRLADPVTHTREFHFEKTVPRWVITDELMGQQSHSVEWFFHLGLDVIPELQGGDLMNLLLRGLVLCSSRGDTLRFHLCEPLPGLTAELLDDWISPSYGVKKPSKTIRLHGRLPLPLRVQFAIHE